MRRLIPVCAALAMVAVAPVGATDPARADDTPTARFTAHAARAGQGSAEDRLAAALVLFDAGRFEQASRFLDGQVRSHEEAHLRRALAALLGPGSGPVRWPAHTLPDLDPAWAARAARLERTADALEALAKSHGSLLARGTPEVVLATSPSGPTLVRLWAHDGTCTTHALEAARLTPARGGTIPVDVAPAPGGLSLRIPRAPGWLFLQVPETAPTPLRAATGRAEPLDAPGLHAVRAPDRGNADLTLTLVPAAPPPGCGRLVTGLIPEPAGPGATFTVRGALPAGGGVATGSLPVALTTPDAALVGRIAGAELLARAARPGLAVTASGCPSRRPLAESLAPLAADLLEAAHRLGWRAPMPAPGAGPTPPEWRILLAEAPAPSRGLARGRTVVLLLDPAATAAPALLAHELVHALLAGLTRGWPGQDPEEGVADYLAAALARSAARPDIASSLRELWNQHLDVRDPLLDIPLPRALARHRLPRPFVLAPLDRRAADAVLTRRLHALERRLGEDGHPADALPAALFAALDRPAAFMTLEGLRDALAARLGRPLPELTR